MPLPDHFRPPLSRSHPWRSFHGTWAAVIAERLNSGVLPSGFYAVPFLHRDGPIEIDVATLRESESVGAVAGEWTPPAPAFALAVEWPEVENVRVEVHADDGDPPLAAVVELVSPRNKDRPLARDTFAAKCADYLTRGCGLVVVDVVTTRLAELHPAIVTALGVDVSGDPVPSLSAVAYRPVVRSGAGQLDVWPHALAVGQRLPTVPLWLGDDRPVPLDLETTHAAACAALRIRTAG